MIVVYMVTEEKLCLSLKLFKEKGLPGGGEIGD